MTDLQLENAMLKQNLLDLNSKLNKLQFEFECLRQSESDITSYFYKQLSKTTELMADLKRIRKIVIR